MKITRIANEFEDEGRSPEENIEEMERYEAQKELEDYAVGKRGPSYTAEVLMSLRDKFGQPIQASWVANGSVGWFKINDLIYEISIAPAAYGKYFGYFQELQQRNKSTPEIENDDLPM